MSMKKLTGIHGMDKVLEKLPDDLQYFYKFGSNIESLNYEKKFDYENSFDEISVIGMILADNSGKYRIKLELFNVTGEIAFDMLNGFFLGFTIEDNFDLGYESIKRYRIASAEQDISFEVFCEDISIELL